MSMMIDDTPLKTPHDVTDALIGRVLLALLGPGVYHLVIDEGRPPQRRHTLDASLDQSDDTKRRVVMAAMPDSEEIMVAMEGSGCIFVDRRTNINPFVFVSAGFQLTAAQIITKVFVGFAAARAEVDANIERKYPQLTHQNRS